MVDAAFRRTVDRMIETLDFTKGIQPEVTKAPEPQAPANADGEVS